MSFWEIMQMAAGVSGGLYWLVLVFLTVAFALFALVPVERANVRTAVLLFVVSYVCLFSASAIVYFGGNADGLGFRGLRFIALFLISVATVMLASVVVFALVFRPLRLHPPRIVRDLLVALAYIIIAITLLSRSGIDIAGVIATSAVITAIIGFSLQDTLGNIMGGMALQMERTIHVGDWVKVDQHEGQVKEIRWRQTSIETRNWDTVVIPNSTLMKSQVIILGRRDGAPRQHRQWVYFNVDFRFAPTQVIQVVEEALCLEPLPNVAHDPLPQCIVSDFKDSYATYAVRYWLTNLALTDPTDSLVRSRIYFALRRAEIPLSIPAQSVFVTEDDQLRRERKEQENIDHRLEAIERVELFHTLAPEEKQQLARRLRNAPFVRGEVMTRQGNQAHWLYLIIQGEAEVTVSIDGQSEKVALLHDGDYFGEMGLMTGEPRRATIIALTDVQCYRLDKEAFKEIIQRRPEIAEDISHTLAKRRVELDMVRESLSEEIIHQRMHHTQKDLLHRMREFFLLNSDFAFKTKDPYQNS